MDTPTVAPSSKSRLEKASFIIFLTTIILAPIAFLPIAYAPLDISKTVVIAFGVLVSSLLYFISALKNKTLIIPKHPIFFVSLGIVASLIVSTALSTNLMKSLFGQGFEAGTTSLIFIFFLALLLSVYLTYKERDRMLYLFGGSMVSFLILAIFHAIRFSGVWNDLALLGGAIGIISLMGLQFITLNKLFKGLLSVVLVFSGVCVLVANSLSVWIAIILVAACCAWYQFFSKTTRRIPVLTLVVLVLAVVCAWKGDMIAAPLVQALKVEKTEILLPWQLTLDVAADTIKESPLFGAGPNRFALNYLKFKPEGVNLSQAWNIEFSSGSGFIPTTVVTQGIVGFLLWCLLVIVLVGSGFSALKRAQDDFSRFFIGSTFFTSFFLWISCFTHSSSHSILLLTFVMTGLFLSTLVAEGHASRFVFTASDNPRSSKFVSFALVCAIIICCVWTLVYAKKTIALGYFQGGISALKTPDNQGILDAEKNFKRALSWDKSDIYYQALSEVNIVKISALSQQLQAQAQQNAKAPDEEAIAQIGKLVEGAVGYTRSAIAFDPTNYYNYVAEARISEVGMSLQVDNAYENTRTAYENALKYNPRNPALYLNLARIEASQNKLTEAQSYIGSALQLKQNYIEAIFLLSQIQVSKGQVKEAITSVRVASEINPTNPLVFFQLGLLYYNDKNYLEAINSLGEALKLNEQYANAQYFLGLSYARLGRSADAIKQFEALALTNPDSEEVALILSNLKFGKSPFADAQPPIDSTPEKRSTLPVKER